MGSGPRPYRAAEKYIYFFAEEENEDAERNAFAEAYAYLAGQPHAANTLPMAPTVFCSRAFVGVWAIPKPSQCPSRVLPMSYR